MKLSILLIALLLVIVAGCALPPGSIRANDSSKVQAGMTRADVIRALGKPDHAITLGENETMAYLLSRPSQQDRPFEVKLLKGVVQRYDVLEREPGKVDPNVACVKQQVGVPWYPEADYARILSLLPAAERDDAVSHSEWIAQTKLMEQEMRNTGFVPVRVPVQAIEVESWSRHHNVSLTRGAVREFTKMRLGLERGHGETIDGIADTQAAFLEKFLTAFSANR